jgi:protein arginine N-methyltransferase 1
MYSIAAFGRMIADDVRTGAYEAAIRAAVRPGHVVLDIGCGTGILSLLACRQGARKVYAVETGDAIAVAEEIVRANDLTDRIELIQKSSTDLTLPEPADVIVSDLRGVLPLLHAHIPSIADARRRHLKPGGVLIPQRDEIYIALVEAPDEYERISAPWRRHQRGFDMEAARRVVTNTWERAMGSEHQLLAEARHWATLDYSSMVSPHVKNCVTFQTTRAGAAHGLIAWFDAVLHDGVGYTSAPGNPDTVYGRAFLPFSEPIAVEAGDRVTVTLRADLSGGEYVWTWNTDAYRGSVEQPHLQLRQSTFFGGPLSRDRIRKRDGEFAPALNADGEVDAAILRAMTGRCSVDQITNHLMEQFPQRFRTRIEAQTRVSDLAERYSL